MMARCLRASPLLRGLGWKRQGNMVNEIRAARWIQSSVTSHGNVVVAPRQQVKIVEVGPRDGLQNESVTVSTEDKISLITKLADAGCSFIEAGSFVSPEWVPSMANSQQVMEGLNTTSSTMWKRRRPVLSCLVPNLKGLDMAMQVHADEIAIFGSASEVFSQKNINCSIDESIERFKVVTDKAKEHNIPIRGYLSCVIGCPYQGKISPTAVARVAEKLLDLGCHELSLGDTIGVGTPASTKAMLEAVSAVIGTRTTEDQQQQLAMHCHDTYGQALVNILTALEHGVTTIDASVAGLGGCPYAQGASGNVATEDLVYMLNGLGVETGIDIDKLVDAGTFICGVLGKESRSKAGVAIAAKRKDS